MKKLGVVLPLFLLLLAAPATLYGQSPGLHHIDHGPLPVLGLPRYPDCAPGMAPGTICRWPSTAIVLPLAATGQPDLPVIGRLVAIIDGPLLVPMDPRAIRLVRHLALSESWWICETDQPAGTFAVEVIADGFCPSR